MYKLRNKDYFDLNYPLSILAAIFIPTSWILGVITRFTEGRWGYALLRVLFGWNIVWVIDLVYMIYRKRIFRLA